MSNILENSAQLGERKSVFAAGKEQQQQQTTNRFLHHNSLHTTDTATEADET